MPNRPTTPGRFPSLTGRQRKQLDQELKAIHRLLIAAKVFYWRYQFEERLLLTGQTPLFRISWDKLRKIADHPSALAGGFHRFMHRLHRLAHHETSETVRAYHAVAKPTAPDVSTPPVD